MAHPHILIALGPALHDRSLRWSQWWQPRRTEHCEHHRKHDQGQEVVQHDGVQHLQQRQKLQKFRKTHHLTKKEVDDVGCVAMNHE